jgi:hypothetical protein
MSSKFDPRPEERRNPQAYLLRLFGPEKIPYMRALHTEYFPVRPDGGLSFKLEDVLGLLARVDNGLVTEEQLASAWGVPEAYSRALRAACQ